MRTHGCPKQTKQTRYVSVTMNNNKVSVTAIKNQLTRLVMLSVNGQDVVGQLGVGYGTSCGKNSPMHIGDILSATGGYLKVIGFETDTSITETRCAGPSGIFTANQAGCSACTTSAVFGHTGKAKKSKKRSKTGKTGKSGTTTFKALTFEWTGSSTSVFTAVQNKYVTVGVVDTQTSKTVTFSAAKGNKMTSFVRVSIDGM
jgi:hypothetical protein